MTTLEDAKMPSLKDKILAQEEEEMKRAKKEEKKDKKAKKLGKRSK